MSTSFLVLFLAEWGDLSQLLTASLAARYHDLVSVGVGAFVALATISALGAALGRTLLRYLAGDDLAGSAGRYACCSP